MSFECHGVTRQGVQCRNRSKTSLFCGIHANQALPTTAAAMPAMAGGSAYDHSALSSRSSTLYTGGAGYYAPAAAPLATLPREMTTKTTKTMMTAPTRVDDMRDRCPSVKESTKNSVVPTEPTMDKHGSAMTTRPAMAVASAPSPTRADINNKACQRRSGNPRTTLCARMVQDEMQRFLNVLDAFCQHLEGDGDETLQAIVLAACDGLEMFGLVLVRALESKETQKRGEKVEEVEEVEE